jgi:hypothetical protein
LENSTVVRTVAYLVDRLVAQTADLSGEKMAAQKVDTTVEHLADNLDDRMVVSSVERWVAVKVAH